MTPSGKNSDLAERLRLMLVTDRRVPSLPLVTAVRGALRGGVTAVIVREGDLTARKLLALTNEVREACRATGALVLVNDRVDVAAAAGADGVHLKRVSLPVSAAREFLGPEAVIGISTHHEDEIVEAFSEGVDYVIYGPVFATPSKAGILAPRGLSEFLRIAARASGPVIGIGGMCADSLGGVATSLPGVDAIRGLLGTDDPEEAARRLRSAIDGETVA